MGEAEEKTLVDSEDTLTGRFLTFSMDDETYGIEIRYVTEIIGLQAITEMPEMPEYIRGIVNLRGRIISVMDVRTRFGKDNRDYDDRTCIIVIDYQGAPIGLIVDSVAEVVTIAEEDTSEPPSLSATGGFIRNIGKVNGSVILLVDCGKLIGKE